MTYPSKFLQKVVDTLLPGLPADGTKPAIPSASAITLDKKLAIHLETGRERDVFWQVLQQLRTVAGGEEAFIMADEETATATIAKVATQDPAGFQTLLFTLKADYYEHEAILHAFQWPTTPPQPAGYPLNPQLNESLLESVKNRGPIWRSP